MSYDTATSKSKNLTDQQFLSYDLKGSFKKHIEAKIDFQGLDWEDVFKLMANAGIEQHEISFFVGAKICGNSIIMRGDFAFNIWNEKHGSSIGAFKIKKRSGRIKLPKASREDDSLTFTINSQPANDFWENHFISANTSNYEVEEIA